MLSIPEHKDLSQFGVFYTDCSHDSRREGDTIFKALLWQSRFEVFIEVVIPSTHSERSFEMEGVFMLQPISGVTAMNFAFKFAGFATVILIADTLVPHLYSSLWPMFATTLALSIVGTIGDILILPRLYNGPSLLLGFFGMTFITYVTPWFWPNNHVTLGAAFLIAIFLTPVEYMLHRYVLGSLFGQS